MISFVFWFNILFSNLFDLLFDFLFEFFIWFHIYEISNTYLINIHSNLDLHSLRSWFQGLVRMYESVLNLSNSLLTCKANSMFNFENWNSQTYEFMKSLQFNSNHHQKIKSLCIKTKKYRLRLRIEHIGSSCNFFCFQKKHMLETLETIINHCKPRRSKIRINMSWSFYRYIWRLGTNF